MSSLRVHQDHIIARATHVLVATETDVPEPEVYATRDDFMGKQCQIHFGAKTTLTEAGTFGRRVAIITRDPIVALDLAILTHDLLVLADSGRWVERTIPIGNGDKFIIIAGYYGFSGSSSDSALYRDNERLLSIALARASQFRKTPYYIIGDINITPEDSHCIATAVQSGFIFDVARDWAPDYRHVQPTFYKPGVNPNMGGKGCTRIDAILCNAAAAKLVQALNYDWEASFGYDHLMLAAPLTIPAFYTVARTLPAKPPFEVKQLQDMKPCDADTWFRGIWCIFADAYAQAILNEDIDRAHQLWCQAVTEL